MCDVFHTAEKASTTVTIVKVHNGNCQRIEGIEVGEGDVDFKVLSSNLDKYNKNTMFLPEVWQGHKNSGEGIWKALEYLEGVGF